MGGVKAVIVAAGSGKRMGAGINKVFLPVKGKPLLAHTLAVFQSLQDIDGIVLVAAPSEVEGCRLLVHKYGFDKVTSVVPGGLERQDSVCQGVRALGGDEEIVLVHDGARPLTSPDLVRQIVAEARRWGAAIPALPVKDTVKRAEDGWIDCTVDRNGLYAVQTPQGFKRQVLLDALAAASEEGFRGTDEASLVERYGGRVRLVPGEEKNIKITTPDDLAIAGVFAAGTVQGAPGGGVSMERREAVGFGFDAHRLVPGRTLVLCGVSIPFDLGLEGHSDADVALHALMDALLGAAGLGDIGLYFPDTDERYRSISSELLLVETLQKTRGAGWSPGNVDITIVAQCPKLSPFFGAMRERLSTVLGLPASLVNVKATTTEGLGFTGRAEGIAAYAVATLYRFVPAGGSVGGAP